MWALVAHHFWGTLGGGELLNASVAQILDELGHNVVLSGVFNFKKSSYKNWFGIDLSKFPTVVLFPFELKAFGILTRALAWKPAERAIRRYNAQLVWFGAGAATYKPLVKYRKNGTKIVEYIHFPFESAFTPKYAELLYGSGFLQNRYGKFPMNIYWNLSKKIIHKYLRENPFTDADLVLANSKWTAEIVKEIYGDIPKVLNPPIAPNVELVTNPPPFETRRPHIIMVGRFAHEKRYKEVIQIFIPQLRKEVGDFKLIILGSATSPTSRRYYEELSEIVKRQGLEKYVELIPNAPREKIIAELDNARAFLHATLYEHWGIAVAEAMARGVPVVAHKSGGTWTDLADSGNHGLGYENFNEAVEHVAKLLVDQNTWQTYSEKALERATKLTYINFASKLSNLIPWI